MKSFIVILALKHENNTSDDRPAIHVHKLKANDFAHAEKKIKKKWTRLNVIAEILQISLNCLMQKDVG